MKGLAKLMDTTNTEHSKLFSLKQIFDIHANDAISKGQVDRILSPVLIMIAEGKFEKKTLATLCAHCSCTGGCLCALQLP